jgi:hypothetical protein
MMLQSKLASSIFSSKSSVKRKRIFKIIIFIICFFLIEAQVAFLLDPGRYKSDFHPRIRWEEFYNISNKNERLDLIFLGSSHAYRSFDPKIFNSSMGINSFNMGHSSQNPVDSYYVLKEVLKYQKPKVVVFEQYFVIDEGENTDFTSATYTYDYIKPSFNKFSCLVNEFNVKDYPKAILMAVRDKNNWIDRNIIKANILREYKLIKQFATGKKDSEETPNKSLKGEVYQGLGYVSNDGIASEKELITENQFKNYNGPNWNEKRLVYNNKVLQLCKENNIKVIMVTAPLPPASLKLIKNYDEIHNKYQKIANNNGVEYLDYNYINIDKKMFTDKNFKDGDHLNTSGVEILDNDLVTHLKPLIK